MAHVSPVPNFEPYSQAEQHMQPPHPKMGSMLSMQLFWPTMVLVCYDSKSYQLRESMVSFSKVVKKRTSSRREQ